MPGAMQLIVALGGQCHPFRALEDGVIRCPWADAHGYFLSALRASNQSRATTSPKDLLRFWCEIVKPLAIRFVGPAIGYIAGHRMRRRIVLHRRAKHRVLDSGRS
jgi:hypothetical protein